jgi:hypothetical protein
MYNYILLICIIYKTTRHAQELIPEKKENCRRLKKFIYLAAALAGTPVSFESSSLKHLRIFRNVICKNVDFKNFVLDVFSQNHKTIFLCSFQTLSE